MSRTRQPPIDRVAHAFSPAEWSGRSLVLGLVVFAVVAAITVVQRALRAEGATGWTITAIHGLIVLGVVPALSMRSVREWRAAQAPRGEPE